MKKLKRKHVEERLFIGLMIASMVIVLSSLALILGAVLVKGLPALNWAMVTQVPKGGYYLGKEGGILNAITGSLALAGGATVLSFIVSLGVVFYLHLFAKNTHVIEVVRLALDVLWGIPSIVFGAFGFTLMLWMGMRASLLGGIITLALLELPVMTRTMDEVMQMVPFELKEAAYALGSTRVETALRVLWRQTLPGLLTAVLLAFGRGIGDAASVLFTAGYTDRLPTSLLRPAASLPLAVFFQLGTPVPEVRQRAYAAALVLTVIILLISIGSRLLTQRFTRHVIR
ncbi:MAG TPA: phosphate ABC transporter permease PstA [Anaerolineae bacterium]|nr:phosphate ABC transporter permease PstA [Anaerolineae bacterium]HQK14907.1 phosphate ABC transporter permease PstA [Anaerolineae bacterium]